MTDQIFPMSSITWDWEYHEMDFFAFNTIKYSQIFCSHSSYDLMGTVLIQWLERLAYAFPPILEVYTLVSVTMLNLGGVASILELFFNESKTVPPQNDL